MSGTFQDLFSRQSKTYAQYRPRYPDELFSYLGSLTTTKDIAWDCGTGNGQAALSLTKDFNKVWATDPSDAQIANATPHQKIEYSVGAEQQHKIRSNSVSLVTVAQALHWFNFDMFYDEVRRVSVQRGILAAWAYDFNEPIQDEIDLVLKELYFDTLGPYWASNNKLIWDGYRDIPFPFPKIETPTFQIKADLNLFEFLGYLGSWSSTTKFIEKNGYSPLEEVATKVIPFWGEPSDKKPLVWKLHLLVGQVK